MKINANLIKRSFIPKGNGVARNYQTSVNTKNLANSAALLAASAGIGTLIAKDPCSTCVFAGISLTSTAVANHFAKKAKILLNQFLDIISRRAHIDAANEAGDILKYKISH